MRTFRQATVLVEKESFLAYRAVVSRVHALGAAVETPCTYIVLCQGDPHVSGFARAICHTCFCRLNHFEAISTLSTDISIEGVASQAILVTQLAR